MAGPDALGGIKVSYGGIFVEDLPEAIKAKVLENDPRPEKVVVSLAEISATAHDVPLDFPRFKAGFKNVCLSTNRSVDTNSSTYGKCAAFFQELTQSLPFRLHASYSAFANYIPINRAWQNILMGKIDKSGNYNYQRIQALLENVENFEQACEEQEHNEGKPSSLCIQGEEIMTVAIELALPVPQQQTLLTTRYPGSYSQEFLPAYYLENSDFPNWRNAADINFISAADLAPESIDIMAELAKRAGYNPWTYLNSLNWKLVEE